MPTTVRYIKIWVARRTKLLALGTATVLTSCASLPPLNFTPSDVHVSGAKIDAALVSTTVTLAGPGEATGKIMAAGFENDLSSLWKTALDDSLTRTAVFTDGSKRHVTLLVKVLELKMPAAGAVMHTETGARYQLVDRDTGTMLYATDVTSDGRVPGDFAFSGFVRARESASRSVKANITIFLERLQSDGVARLAGR